MSEVFFDTNVLLRIFNEEVGFEETIEDIAEIKSSGHNLNISCITHFELLLGYYLYGKSNDFLEEYGDLRDALEIQIIDLTVKDVELAAAYCKSKSKIRDYFIGSTVKNRNGYLLTYNLADFTWMENVLTPRQFLSVE